MISPILLIPLPAEVHESGRYKVIDGGGEEHATTSCASGYRKPSLADIRKRIAQYSTREPTQEWYDLLNQERELMERDQ